MSEDLSHNEAYDDIFEEDWSIAELVTIDQVSVVQAKKASQRKSNAPLQDS